MRTRRTVIAALTAALAASALAATPALTEDDSTDHEPVPAEPCEDTVGRELLTLDGMPLPDGTDALVFEAPMATAPETTATTGETGENVTPHRSASFFFTNDVAPYTASDVTFTLTWQDAPSDYDMFLYRGGRLDREIARSASTNIEDGDTRVETMTVELDDCETVDLRVKSWAGAPTQALTLEITVEPVGEPLEDILPRDQDTRLSLFATAEVPGNLTTPGGTVDDTAGSEEYPFNATFTTARPLLGRQNVTARPVAGSRIEENPAQPWWTVEPEGTPAIDGTPTALVWISSPTQQEDPGTIYVQLFLDGKLTEVAIDGADVTSEPTPYFIEFEPVTDSKLKNVSMQISALPVVSPNDMSEHAGDANHEAWFGSIQFQTRVFLPVVVEDEDA